MIHLHNISLGYGMNRLIVRAEERFLRGELTALVGRNGAGKSTLMRTIMGIDSPCDGAVFIDGSQVTSLTPERAARTIAYVGTERVRIANLRCEDVVAIGRSPYTNWMGRMQAEDRRIVAEALEAVGMTDFARREVGTLSDGEMQRVMIARAIAQQTPIILLDEPTAFLDIPTRFELCRLLQRLAHDEGKCILFSTHDVDSALPVCDSVAIIDERRLTKYTAREATTIISQLFTNGA